MKGLQLRVLLPVHKLPPRLCSSRSYIACAMRSLQAVFCISQPLRLSSPLHLTPRNSYYNTLSRSDSSTSPKQCCFRTSSLRGCCCSNCLEMLLDASPLEAGRRHCPAAMLVSSPRLALVRLRTDDSETTLLRELGEAMETTSSHGSATCLRSSMWPAAPEASTTVRAGIMTLRCQPTVVDLP